ncbi:MAG TPA: D-cysteine desulfhydrase family protein [Terriglobales bacterium]|nr:D-cysteine desulfhydrase family protein [Terriglobales bacterium]
MPVTAASSKSLANILDCFPRCSLADLPTPFESLPALSSSLGIKLFVKRDDQTGLAMGGNKVRKLEYVLADALSRNSDCIITWAGLQSNWCRQLSAAARKCGIKPVLILFRRPGLPTESDGNLLLDRIYGAEIHIRDLGDRSMMRLDSVRECVEEIADAQRRAGHRPYIVPIGGSALEGSMLQPLGAISYVRAMLELLEQVQNRGLKIDGIVFPTGSGSMHAGILVGAKLLCPTLRVVGVSVSESVAEMTHIVGEIAEQTLRELRMHSQFEAVIDKDDIRVFDYVRNGYGVLDSGIMSTIRRVAEAEGLLLDPVYTAKAMLAMFDLCQQGYFRPGENVVFLHTGGLPAIFAYGEAMLRIGSAKTR